MSSRGGTAIAIYLPCGVFAGTIDVNTILFWECFNTPKQKPSDYRVLIE
jgi:hypothetical protein